MNPGYILDLYLLRIDQIELSIAALFTLFQFTKSRELSTYQIAKALKTTKYEVDYKNVHKKIKRFLNCGLIEKTETKDRRHNSQFYRLTSAGIFALFYHLRGESKQFNSEILNMLNGLLTNYGQDYFFKVFVYPFFNRETVLSIRSKIIIELFLNYCTECTHKSMSKLYEQKLMDDNLVFASKDKIRNWISGIKNEMDSYSKDDKFIIKYNELKLCLSDINDRLLSDLGFEKVSILENTIIFPIISQGKYKAQDIPGIEHSPMYNTNWRAIEKDIILLVEDQSFYKILEATKNGFNKCYKNIMACRNYKM